ncbi:hypothetical protein ROS1_59130 [Roseibium sp. ROS1]
MRFANAVHPPFADRGSGFIDLNSIETIYAPAEIGCDFKRCVEQIAASGHRVDKGMGLIADGKIGENSPKWHARKKLT